MRTESKLKLASSLSLGVLALLTSTEAFAGQNLVGTTFDTSIPSVSPMGGVSFDWSGTKDAFDNPISGSMFAQNLTPSTNSGGVLCVPVTATASYDVGVRMMIPSTSTGTGSAGLFLVWFDNVNCTGNQKGSAGGTYANLATKDTWQVLKTNGVGAPGTAKSAWVYININNGINSPGPIAAYYDDLYVSPAMAAAEPQITSAMPGGADVLKPYDHDFAADGSPLIAFHVMSGPLPKGMTLTPAGKLSGAPEEAGSFPLIIAADNGVGEPAVQQFTFEVKAQAVDPGTPSGGGGGGGGASVPDAPPAGPAAAASPAPEPVADQGRPPAEEAGCNASGHGTPASFGFLGLLGAAMILGLRRRR